MTADDRPHPAASSQPASSPLVSSQPVGLDTDDDPRPVVLEAKALGKTFGGGFRRSAQRVLHDVSFALRKQQIVALVGESGSGKSTVARVLAGLLAPSEGCVELHGKRALDAKRGADLAYRRALQLVFQDPFASLNPIQRVGYHLERPLLRHALVRGKVALSQRIETVLHTVGLPPDITSRFPHELSGGQRQRVAIARALCVEPDVLVADEPTSMLDVSIRIGILNLLAELRDGRGTTSLFITHDIASARYLAETTLVMYAGQVVERGPTDRLIAAPAHPYTELLLSAVPEPGRPLLGTPASVSTGIRGDSAGCRFVTRCARRSERCERETPELRPLSLDRAVRCHHPNLDGDAVPAADGLKQTLPIGGDSSEAV